MDILLSDNRQLRRTNKQNRFLTRKEKGSWQTYEQAYCQNRKDNISKQLLKFKQYQFRNPLKQILYIRTYNYDVLLNNSDN